MQKYLEMRSDDNDALLVTLDASHVRLKISGVEIRLRNLGKQVKVERIHPHKFRRTMATRAIERDVTNMMYPYMTFNDDTEVTHSQMLDDGSVKVYIETPVEDGFKNLTCLLPEYQYENHGYDEKELNYWKAFIQNKPTANATKFWITRSGKTILANNNSRIADKQLRLLQRIIEANSENIMDKWKEHFGEINFYC